jgi:hypothetical protein
MARALYNTIRQLAADRIGRGAIDRLKSAFASFSATVTSEGSVKFGLGPQSSAGIAEALGYSSVRGGSALRASLIEKGVVYSTGRGELDFTVPKFAAFLRKGAVSGDRRPAAS